MDKLAFVGCLLSVAFLVNTVTSQNDEFVLEFAVVFLDEIDTSSTASMTTPKETTTVGTTDSPSLGDNSNDTYGFADSGLQNWEEDTFNASEHIMTIPFSQNETALQFLNMTYQNETGQLGFITVRWTGTYLQNDNEQEYEVVYDIHYLRSDYGLFDELITGVQLAQRPIWNMGNDYGIDGDETYALPQNGDDEVQEQVIRKAEEAGCDSSCDKGETCYIGMCEDSCYPFNEETGCESNKGLFSTGKCMLDNDRYTPSCFCDDWGLWGESGQSAIFHNNQCISVDFLMAVCIGVVCLILTILLITICCLAKRNHDQEKELEDIRGAYDKISNTTMANHMYERNCKNPANTAETKDNGEYIHLQLREPLDRGFSANSLLNGAVKGKKRESDMNMPIDDGPSGEYYNAPKKIESDLYMSIDDGPSGGYYNASFNPKPGAPWDSKSRDITETDAYKNFQAHVDHINPKANERDVPIPSFKI